MSAQFSAEDGAAVERRIAWGVLFLSLTFGWMTYQALRHHTPGDGALITALGMLFSAFVALAFMPGVHSVLLRIALALIAFRFAMGATLSIAGFRTVREDVEVARVIGLLLWGGAAMMSLLFLARQWTAGMSGGSQQKS